LKSLQSDIELNTIVSIIVVSVLLIGFSIVISERLYVDFVSNEVDAMSENLSIDLMETFENPQQAIRQTELLLRLDEYPYVEAAAIIDSDNVVRSRYIGHAASGIKSELASSISSFKDMPVGLHELDGSVAVVKTIGDESYPLGILALQFDLQRVLSQSRQDFIMSVAPLVAALILIFFIITRRLQKRSLRPLGYLIETMNSVVNEKNYSVEVRAFRKQETAALSHAFNNMMANIRHQTTINRQKTERLISQQQEVERLANLDALTNLPNRQNLMSRLDIALKIGQKEGHDIALMFLDMDGFKAINDTFGHDLGDKYLAEISRSIACLVPKHAVFGRLGGDEFLIILEQENDMQRLNELATRIIQLVEGSDNIQGLRLSASMSIGIAFASESGFVRSQLITNADIAMYKAKELGKGQCATFTFEMRAERQRQKYIASKISQGLHNNAFFVVYQAKVNHRKQVVGFEALLRWEDEELGNISPAEFIPIAEASDKIAMLTTYVIDAVCADLPSLIDLYNDEIVVSINLSPQDIHHIEVTEKILDGLDAGLIPKKYIEFEITETSFMQNIELANGFFCKIKQKGVHLSLDDFGTGYSSLSYLSELSVDTLKIDRQFVSQIGQSKRSEQVTTTIIELAKSLNCQVCAEGIETEAQAQFLIERGCHMLQGFLYSRPEPLSVLKENPILRCV